MVRSSPVFLARPVWYDRNPAVVPQEWRDEGVAPHAAATRWTYTIPAGKKGLVELAFCQLVRITAASAAGRARTTVTFKPYGGAGYMLLHARVYTNTVGDRDSLGIGHALIMLAGDELWGVSEDTSTGGTFYMTVTAKITTFDA